MHGPLAYLHVASASTALLSGLFVVLWRKGRTLHRLMGLLYVFAILMTNISALMIYRLTGRFDLFHVFALLSLFTTLAGLVLAIVRPRNRLAAHAAWMSWSYLGLVAAALNELLTRLPLHLNTPPRIFAAGIVVALFIMIAGTILRPRWKLAASRHAAQPGG